MNKTQFLNQYYTQESIVKITTSYILYYQISLGNLTYETSKDKEEATSKLENFQLVLTPNDILLSIFMISLTNEEITEKNFDKLIQKKAINHALNDFILKNENLLNKDVFIEQKLHQIEKDVFFTTSMKMKYLSQYSDMTKHYEEIITSEYTKNVKEILNNNF